MNANSCGRMDNLLSIKDKLTASSSKRKKKQALRLDKAIFRMRRKIKHLQSEVHKKSVAFYTREFDAIIIPPFETSNIVNRKTRRTTLQTVLLGHYQFRQCLVEELGVRVIIQNEAYTSKTCRRYVQMPKLWDCNGSR